MAAPAARFKLTSTGDLDPSFQIETNIQNSVAGKARKILLLFQASWYLDLSKGVPWIQQILCVKNPNLRVVLQALSAALTAGIPELQSIQGASLTYQRSTRSATYSAVLVTTVGAVPVNLPLQLP